MAMSFAGAKMLLGNPTLRPMVTAYHCACVVISAYHLLEACCKNSILISQLCRTTIQGTHDTYDTHGTHDTHDIHDTPDTQDTQDTQDIQDTQGRTRRRH